VYRGSLLSAVRQSICIYELVLQHEHQNPSAGIVWDEPKVIRRFAGGPNYWPEETTRHNILDKLDSSLVVGSDFDEKSIMVC
jgi:hypothetical protein